MLNGQTLTVSLYHEFLGPSGGRKERSFTIPEPIKLSPAVSQKLTLVVRSHGMSATIPLMLLQYHASLDTESCAEGVLLCCSITKDTEDSRRLVKTWAQNAQGALNEHLEKICVSEEAMSTTEFAEAEAELKQLADQAGAGAGVVYQHQEQKVCIVYHDDDQGRAAGEMKAVIRNTKKRLDRIKQEKIEMVRMAKQEVEMLQARKVEHSVLARYQELVVSYDAAEGNITLKGLVPEIAEMKRMIEEQQSEITLLAHTFDSPLVAKLLSSAEAKSVLKEACQKGDPEGKVVITSDGFTVRSFDASKASLMKTAGVESIYRKEIPLSSEQEKAVKLDDFAVLLASLVERNQGVLVVDQDRPSRLVVLGVSPTFHEDVKIIEDFLEENRFLQETFDMEPPDHDLFRSFLQKQDEQTHDVENVLQYDAANSMLTATMTKGGLTEIQRLVESFRTKLVSRTREFTEPSFSSYIHSEGGKRKLKQVQKKWNCTLGELVDAALLQGASEHAADAHSPLGASAPGGEPQATRREFLEPQTTG